MHSVCGCVLVCVAPYTKQHNPLAPAFQVCVLRSVTVCVDRLPEPSLSFQWSSRCGHGLLHGDPSLVEASPLFLQFLDALHQLLEQAPNAFEFTDALLLWLSEAVYSGA